MQVKKFEARTMKEALEMVKTQLGPEAIILSAKDHGKSYGLLGQGSVEITAAIRDESLHKKKFIESRIGEADREKLMRAPAKIQKKTIDRYVENFLKTTDQKKAAMVEAAPREQARGVPPAEALPTSKLVGSLRYIDILDEEAREIPSAGQLEAQKMLERMNYRDEELFVLREEISSLKLLLENLQRGPQNINTSYPGLSHGIPYELSSLYSKLVGAGLADALAAEALNLAKDILHPSRLKQRATVEGWVARYLLETTKIAPKELKAQIQCFIGPMGAGKTSTLVKMASHLIVREQKKVAIISADSDRVGSFEQMRIFSHILNVPFASVRTSEDWEKSLQQLSYADCILCDFPSVNFRSTKSIVSLQNLFPNPSRARQTHLVVSALMSEPDLEIVGERIRDIKIDDVIFTGLDQAAQHGCLYNFMKKYQTPLYAFGIGSKIPEDFEYATRERVLDLILRITKSMEKEAAAS